MRLVQNVSRRVAVVVCLLLLPAIVLTGRAAADENFSVREYKEFHDVLHPLQHDALPNKDFQRIRTNAAEMVKRGKAIVQVGLPTGTPTKHHEEFRKELKKFESALGDFSKQAQDGTDTQVETSFSAVHDSFEMLVGMLPRK